MGAPPQYPFCGGFNPPGAFLLNLALGLAAEPSNYSIRWVLKIMDWPFKPQ